ncbi:hypothetical protein MBOE_04110 [Mycolicibacterium boenickei]|uniref:Uncharacterized protein n=1 Tax=Mycolicibacterium boenickei TaxID=146017 RepID=A0ABM7IPN4_9MYCO|nr:hypothetical protein MBOE_04110 [Mycolicibacterium boenickei]
MRTGSPAESALQVDQIVTSVGPYALNIRRPGAHAATNSAGHASPPVTNVSNPSI